MTHDALADGLPDISLVKDAVQRLQGHAVRTRLLESALLNERLGCRFFIKPEMLQRTGSFKFRGAYTRISRLTDTERAGGVVAFSSGNHAQGVAAAATMHGIASTIIMPEDAPSIKVENTRALGATIVPYNRFTEDREQIAETICAEKKAAMVRPYDDKDIISGQGTVGLEIAEDLEILGLSADIVIAPCGGGGLISGTALALSDASPTTKVWAAEPEGFDDTVLSLVKGKRVINDPNARTICDALASPTPGILTFELNRQLLAGGLVVSETDIGKAMREAFRTFKVVVEPGGSVALAAALTGKLDVAGKTVVAICSGGNVDADLYAKILNSSD
ncbi:MAG: threonine/serine dehydratase [Rhodospirillales bacterium]|nr:threonine/serine dehydratase [Rhodospirillales bacterium]